MVSMSYVERLDYLIFLCVCAFAASFGINNFVADQFIGIAVLLAVFRFIKEKPSLVIPNEYKRPILLFFCIFFVLVFFSPDIIKSAKEYWRYANRMFPFLIVVFFIKDLRRLLMIMSIMVISLSINNLYAIYQGIEQVLLQQTYIRAVGIDISAIELAGYLLILLPILFILMLEKTIRGWYKFIVCIMFIIGITTLALNGTRIVWCIIGLLLSVSLFIYIKNLKRAISIFLITCIGMGIVVCNIPFLAERAQSFVNINNHSNKAHYLIMRDSLEMIQDHPILGVGMGRFQVEFNTNYISNATKKLEPHVSHAHNTLMTIWAESGIAGCIVFGFMFGSFLYYSAKSWLNSKRSEDFIFMLITLGTILQGITDYSFGLHQVMKFYFFVMALYLNYRYYSSKNTLS